MALLISLTIARKYFQPISYGTFHRIFDLRSVPVALLSSDAALPSKGDSSFVKERRIYQKQVSELRKIYRDEILKKRAAEEKRKREERARIQAEKRVRKAKKRSRALRSLKKEEEKRLQQAERYRAYREEMDVLRQERHAKTRLAVENMLTQMKEESNTWITPDNVDEKITEELFTNRGSTGLMAPSSYYMRYATDIDWGKDKALDAEENEDILEKLMSRFDNEAVVRTQIAREFAEDFSSTVDDVENREQYVNEISEILKEFELHFEDERGNDIVYNEQDEFDKDTFENDGKVEDVTDQIEKDPN